MKRIDKEERINKWEERSRARLMNCLSGIKNATLIGSISEDGQSNLAVFSSLFHLGANPALMGIVFRPVEGDTLRNIKHTKAFTLNHLRAEFSQKIHHTSARFNSSEFNDCKLDEEFLDGFSAPFVKQANIKWSMILKRIIDVPENGTHIAIAEVEDIYLADKSMVREDGSLDITDELCGVVGLDSYHSIENGVRYTYAKPDLVPQLIPES